jgi:hypothetical protein
MINNKSYKLARYEIIESSNGTLRWESHAGLSGLKAGKCLIIGNVLVIGPHEMEKPGFLKREFLEHLNKLPQWDKTEYYCPSHVLYSCETGVRISFDAEKGGSQDKPPPPSRNHATHKRPNSKTMVNRESYRKEAIGNIKIKINKAGELLKLWYGKISKR